MSATHDLRKRVAEIDAAYDRCEPVTATDVGDLLDYIDRLEAIVRAADEMEQRWSLWRIDGKQFLELATAVDNYRKARDAK